MTFKEYLQRHLDSTFFADCENCPLSFYYSSLRPLDFGTVCVYQKDRMVRFSSGRTDDYALLSKDERMFVQLWTKEGTGKEALALWETITSPSPTVSISFNKKDIDILLDHLVCDMHTYEAETNLRLRIMNEAIKAGLYTEEKT